MEEVIYFASRADLKKALHNLVDEHELDFVHTGLFDHDAISRMHTLDSWKSLGVNSTGNYIGGDSFLIVPRSASIHVEKVEQEKGSVKFSISQKGNEETVQLVLSGEFNEELIAGRLATVSDLALTTFGAVKASFLKGFKRVQRFYVGAEAYEWLVSGKRLTTHARSSMSLQL